MKSGPASPPLQNPPSSFISYHFTSYCCLFPGTCQLPHPFKSLHAESMSLLRLLFPLLFPGSWHGYTVFALDLPWPPNLWYPSSLHHPHHSILTLWHQFSFLIYPSSFYVLCLSSVSPSQMHTEQEAAQLVPYSFSAPRTVSGTCQPIM